LLVLAALVALLCLPCLLALVIFADVAMISAERSVRRRAGRWRARREAVRLERSTGFAASRWPLHPRPPADTPPAGPPFEQVVADLRRLARQRAELASRSPVWSAALHRAYDERLRIACRELEIPEHLHGLEGVDLELERLRVEGALAAAGLSLAAADRDGRQDTR
jgi:hypothetical protein